MTRLVDVLYPVRDGEANKELRYSLRSLAANLPHDRVWLVGHQPNWVSGVKYIPGGNRHGYHANVYQNLLLALHHPDLSDQVIVFNDDFFVTEKIADVPVTYRGKLTDHIGRTGVRGWWQQSLMTTRTCLQAHGIADPISYELHMPMVVDRRKIADVLAQFRHVTPDNPPQWRTLYGNMCDIGGIRHHDVKANVRTAELHTPFHSTSDRNFPHFLQRLHARFPTPCRYESPVPA